MSLKDLVTRLTKKLSDKTKYSIYNSKQRKGECVCTHGCKRSKINFNQLFKIYIILIITKMTIRNY